MSIKQITTGQDSFLDIVANLVGVLIILVVVVGAQAKAAYHATPTKIDNRPIDEIQQELQRASDTVKKLEIDNGRLDRQLIDEANLVDRLAAVRHQMLVEQEIVQRQIAEQKQLRRKNLDEREQEELDRREAQQVLRRQLEKIESETRAVAGSQPKRETIEHYPNPIAKTVFTNEIHFQLKAGRIAYVPLEELVSRMKSEWKVTAEKLNRASSTVETVGPIGNFRLQYALLTETQTQQTQYGPVKRQGIRFDRFTIFPASENLGQETKSALESGSTFVRQLERFPPGKTTVSLWVYPDSYADYNAAKKWLYENGYQVACWPLDFGKRISGGPNGLQTSAQ